jgi:hypothetical protein
MAEAFTVAVVFAAAADLAEALTAEDLDAEASAATAGSAVVTGSAVAAVSTAVADFTVAAVSMAVVAATAADTAKTSRTEIRSMNQTADGICRRPFFFH